MGLLDKLWDDVVAGPAPEHGLGRLRHKNVKIVVDQTAMDGEMSSSRGKEFSRSTSMISQSITIKPPELIRAASFNDHDSAASTPTGSIPDSPSSLASPGFTREKESVWRSVFHPGGPRSKTMERGSANYDTVSAPNSPSIYDWMYSPESKTKWHS